MPCILVVDGDLDTREIISSILTDEGFSVWSAADGAGAIEQLARQEKPSVILLDVRGTLDWIKTRIDFDGVKLIAMTTDSAPVRDGRVVATLRKPFDVAELLRVAKKYCT